MATLAWKRLIGQQRIKEIFSSAFSTNSLGHAYMLSGEEGTGKLQAALELAMALLCKEPENAPCYQCDSCRRILNHSHPDLHLLFPVSLRGENKGDGGISQKGWERITELTQERIKKPYVEQVFEGVPSIPVEWTRDVVHAIVRGAIEGPRCVTIIDGIDMMNKESANTMLKTLEEPPPDAIMFLLTDRLHATLQTIVSRCQVLRLGYLNPEELAAGIKMHGDQQVEDTTLKTVVPLAMGSLGRALNLIDSPDRQTAEYARSFLALCLEQNWLELGEMIDELSAGGNYEQCRRVFFRIAFLVRNASLQRSGDTQKYILEDIPGSQTTQIPPMEPSAARAVLKQCQDAMNALAARSNIALTLVTFGMSLPEIIHGKEYKAG